MAKTYALALLRSRRQLGGLVVVGALYLAGYVGSASAQANVTSDKNVARTVPTAVELGGNTSCAILDDTTVKCWGDNSRGQIGDGTAQERRKPVAVPGLVGVTAMSLGQLHSCALLQDQTVKCWGTNFYGQLGDGTTTDRLTPVAVTGLTGVKAISVGDEHSCALLDDATVKCWGLLLEKKLDDGWVSRQQVLPETVTNLTGVTAISAGDRHTCVVLENKTVKCWGWRVTGSGTTVNAPTPVEVAELTGVAAISAGDSHTCAVLENKTVKCWGEISGLGGTSLPTKVFKLAEVTSISVGGHQDCALVKSKTVTCWGDVQDGFVNGRTEQTKLVARLNGVASISGGTGHMCALLENKTVKCWGDNRKGQIGDGTIIARATPVVALSSVPTTPASPSKPATSTTASAQPEPSSGSRSPLQRPRTIAVTSTTDKPLSAIVKWEKPSNVGKQRVSYRVYTLEDPAVTCWTKKTSCSVSVQPGATYNFRVVAIDGSGMWTEPAIKKFKMAQPWYVKNADGNCLIARLPGMKTVDLNCGNQNDSFTWGDGGSALIDTGQRFTSFEGTLFTEPLEQVRTRINRALNTVSSALGRNFAKSGKPYIIEFEISDEYGARCDGYVDAGLADSSLIENIESNYCPILTFRTRSRIVNRNFDSYFKVVFGPRAGDGKFPVVDVHPVLQSIKGNPPLQHTNRLLFLVTTSWAFCEGDC